MKHLNEEQLILYHYGETGDRKAAEAHLETCGDCRSEYDELRQTLAAVEALPVPERNEGYGREVWARLQPRLEEKQRGWFAWMAPRDWVLAGAMVLVLLVGILVGRFTTPPAYEDGAVRERILLVAVGDHLERSQMVLVELVNAGGNGPVDISAEQEWAQDLVADNRLYRLTAAGAGEVAVADLLEELERVLLEIAHSSGELSAEEFSGIRERIEAQGLIFKIRVLGSQVREREEADWDEPADDNSHS